MNEIKNIREDIFIFKNYKLLKEEEIRLRSGSIWLFQGPNHEGKTTVLNGLKAIMTVKDDTINPVYNPNLDPHPTTTELEKEGFITGTIHGADQLPYQFRYDFNIDGKKKFQFIDQNGKVISSMAEMRAIFNYTHFTLEEFFEWSKSEPGRKKQREIFMGLLTEKDRADIIAIDEKVHPTKGEFIESRRALNTEVDFLKKKVDTSILTMEETKLLSQKEDINKTFDELQINKANVEKLINGASGIVERIKSITEQLQQLTDNHVEYVTNHNHAIDDIDRQIEALQLRKTSMSEALIIYVDIYDKKQITLDAELKTLNASGTITPEELEVKQQELNTINERITKGQLIKDSIIKIETKTEGVKYEKEQLEIKTKKAAEYDTKIETLRETKKNIIKNNPNIPLGWSLTDDYLTINGIPFMESDLSKSQATKAIAELMIRINKCPIMLMGDAEALGYEILDELDVYAKEQGKIMVFAEHVRQAEELQLVCYDDLEHKPAVKKDIF